MGHVVSCLSSAVWTCRQRVQVESEDGSDRFESTFDGSTRTPRTTGTTGTTMSMDTGILGMALRLRHRLSQESLGCWLMLVALVYALQYCTYPGPWTQFPFPGVGDMHGSWTPNNDLSSSFGHQIPRLRRRSRQGCKIHLSISISIISMWGGACSPS